MDGNKRPSGAEFRKRRKHEEEKIKNYQKLTLFLLKNVIFREVLRVSPMELVRESVKAIKV